MHVKAAQAPGARHTGPFFCKYSWHRTARTLGLRCLPAPASKVMNVHSDFGHLSMAPNLQADASKIWGLVRGSSAGCPAHLISLSGHASAATVIELTTLVSDWHLSVHRLHSPIRRHLSALTFIFAGAFRRSAFFFLIFFLFFPFFFSFFFRRFLAPLVSPARRLSAHRLRPPGR